MKTSPFFRLRSVLLLTLGSLALTQVSEAKPDNRGRGKDKHFHKSNYHGGYDRDYRSDRYRTQYMGRSRSSFTLSFGNGYAGNGYYYGPPSASYYYQRPGVTYYRTRSAVPRAYWSTPGYYASPGYQVMPGYTYSDAAGCQRALARRGYYRGPIDGDIGPGTRSAIRAYQLRNGLTVTGYVDRGLLISLGLR